MQHFTSAAMNSKGIIHVPSNFDAIFIKVHRIGILIPNYFKIFSWHSQLTKPMKEEYFISL
jgi:hypothetical protein